MLVGRESEQQSIERLLAGARIGTSGVLVLSGEPGIGKTTLLDQARVLAAGMRILTARGVEAEREVAFGGLHQICAPLLDLLGELPPPQAEALEVALAMRAGPAPQRFAVGAAVLGLLTRAADDSPVAVLIDDAHLLDQSSAQAISFAARRLVSDRVGVIAGMRPDVDSPLSSLPTLVVGPLGIDATRALVSSGEPGVWAVSRLARFHEATGGNPLAILELSGEVERLSGAPPDTPLPLSGELLAAFSRRIDALSEPARGVLLLAATDSLDLRALRRATDAAGLPLEALSEAEAADLVRVGPAEVEFRHPLVRAAVYGAAEPAARRAAHRLMAEAVPPDDLDRRAWHRAEAALGPDEAAAHALDAAALRSSSRGAYAVASSQWQRAATMSVDVEHRGTWLLRAGEQAWLSGSSAEAMRLMRQALAITTAPLQRAMVLGRLGGVEGRCGSLLTARDLQLAAAQTAADADPEAAVTYLADAVESCLYLCDTAGALELSEHLVRMRGPHLGPRVNRLASLAAGVAMILGEHTDRGPALIRAAMAEAVPEDESDQWSFRWSLIGPMFLREGGAARAAMDDAVEVVRARAAVGTLPFLLTLIARYDAGVGDWADAESGYTEAIRLAQEAGHQTDLALALAGLAWLEARQGREDEAQAHADEATALAEEHLAHLAQIWAQHARADSELAQGRVEEATQAYQSLAALLDDLTVSDPDLSPAAELVDLHCQVGDLDAAAAIAGDFSRAARAKGQPWALARAHRAMALAAPGLSGESEFLTALALHDRAPDPYESARTQLAFGARLRRARRRADARPQLRAALRTFEQLHAHPWADRAAAELEATGETALRRGAGVITGLTPQERQIAALLAAGRTTREAAAALFLSPKTVEYHLRHVYIKLGIRSRAELADALAEDQSAVSAEASAARRRGG